MFTRDFVAAFDVGQQLQNSSGLEVLPSKAAVFQAGKMSLVHSSNVFQSSGILPKVSRCLHVTYWK